MNDHISAAGKNRYFPLLAAALLPRLREFVHDERWPPYRISLQMRNVTAECRYGHQLCLLSQAWCLASFSLPQTIPPALGRLALHVALWRLLQIERAANAASPVPQPRRQKYRAFLGPLSTLTITRASPRPWRLRYPSRYRHLQLGRRDYDCSGQQVIACIDLTRQRHSLPGDRSGQSC
jgi:hypothetical protein